ncbi:nucleotidyltransferase domain-containing protein [Clostridium sp. DJ247]|uniref:nucleotidyltransferase domain-containing protein n=1 Tax=Clostridium sp. DJ247 TaxID=2726188 RepID=UPI0016247E12|nr:nucleotidyltransferase domain-containing protein [Clostridium sp. DJ247]MBC2582631.1 hypothetical protein [Clostridium sp. DJ247]
MKKLTDLNIRNTKNLIALAIFGSFETEFWIKGKSDIDILVLLEKADSLCFEFDLEDELIPLLQEYFSYDNIHLTFLHMNEFESPLAIKYIESKNKLIIDPIKEIDFRLYVNKYKRNNQWLEDLIKHDNEILRSRKI